MSKVNITEHAVQLAYLAEYQSELNDAADQATLEYLSAQQILAHKLQAMREACDLRDAMSAARKYVGGQSK